MGEGLVIQSSSGRQFFYVEQYFRKYQAVKAEIEESGPSSNRVDRLQGLAKELSRELGLDCLEDAKAFLDSMKQ